MRTAPIWTIAVAAGGIEAGGLGIEHDVAELAERPLEPRSRLRRAGQQVEVVELRAGRQACRRRRGAELRRARAGQGQTQQGMAGAGVRLAPELAAVAADDIAQRPAAGVGERLLEPPLERAERERRPWPDQIEIDPRGARGGFQIELRDAGRRMDRARQPLEQAAQLIAVAVQPGPGADHGQRDRRARGGEAAVDPAGEVGAVEIGARAVARAERLGGRRQRPRAGR